MSNEDKEVVTDVLGALLYAGQLYKVLASKDPAMTLANPISWMVLRSLLVDLAAIVPTAAGERLRAAIDELGTRP